MPAGYGHHQAPPILDAVPALKPARARAALSAAGAVPLLLLCACGSTSSSTAQGAPASPSQSGSSSSVSCDYADAPQGKVGHASKPPATPDVSGTVSIRIKTTIGTIGATLDASAAPCTVNSFVSLAKQGYFDKTPCHRLTTAGIFVLQCGDPTGTGTGGPGYTVPDELSGKETYGAGTLAMANAGPNTGGSQFFIVYRDTTLQPNYTVFGHVVAGLGQVKRIAKQGSDDAYGPGDGHPKVPVSIESVTLG
jgi:peptidyl-prolyl cis-trans isomerase B (cyclophilin B)